MQAGNGLIFFYGTLVEWCGRKLRSTLKTVGANLVNYLR
jgi:hypothetical protein